jgi:hypothetical protein
MKYFAYLAAMHFGKTFIPPLGRKIVSEIPHIKN